MAAVFSHAESAEGKERDEVYHRPGMAFALLADAVVVVHLAFIVFVATGALLALRWPRLLWLHVPALGWSVGIITVGYECPLTPLEKWLRGHAGEPPYPGGFVDRYVEDVVYPGELTPLLRAVAALVIVTGYALLLRRRDLAQAGKQASGHA